MASEVKATDFKTEVHIDWCPGCGDYGTTSALQQALAKMGIQPYQIALFSGIGCSGKFPHYFATYGYHTLHGRVLPYAIGCKLANPQLTVIAIGGDGDGLGIGACHFVHAGRHNVDITYILQNNGVYGLTKGQASPTLGLGIRTRHLAKPNPNEAFNPILMALSSGYTFIARTYSYNIRHMVKIFTEAIQHHGSSFVEVLQGCPTYNDIWTSDYYMGKDLLDAETGKPTPRIYDLQEEGYDPVLSRSSLYEPEHRERQALLFQKVMETGNRIPIGIFLVNPDVTTYEERIETTIPNYRECPPALRRIHDAQNRPAVDIQALVESLRVT